MEELIAVLERIAAAFEEQNRYNLEWIALQKQWHEEGNPTGERIVAIHEQNAEREDRHRAEMLYIAQEQTRQANAKIEAILTASLASFEDKTAEKTDE